MYNTTKNKKLLFLKYRVKPMTFTRSMFRKKHVRKLNCHFKGRWAFLEILSSNL